MTRPATDTRLYLNRLKDREDDQLATEAEQVASLADHPGWQALTRLVSDLHDDTYRALISGHRSSTMEHVEYARSLGFLAGLGEHQAAMEAFAVADERRRERNQKAAERP